tara:strand:- start:4924 stop:5922 length:999 start_codon:yes stop_codon:yes gene_type:complete
MIKKFIKKIGKGIRTGLKSIGKAFKKAFKGIGKFIGKLGPIGMLGMMLIMPQMASWWGSFGNWAGTLGKGFGSVMRGIHKAGTMVGKAYSTVTDTISGTMNKITGGSFARPGGEGMFAGEYVEGASDKLANWMSGQVDKGRDFLGLETQEGLQFQELTQNADEIVKMQNATKLDVNMNPNDILSDYTTDVKGYVYDTKGMTGQEFGNSVADKALNPIGRNIDGGIQFKTMEGYVGPTVDGVTPKPVVPKTTGEKIWDTGKSGYTAAKVGQDVMQTFGINQEEFEPSYGGYVAEAALPMYESAQMDWTNNGFVGTPSYGIGSPDFFRSIYSYA